MLIISATNMPVSGPVSVAISSSRSPFGPVMTMRRFSIMVGSALHDGALARRYSGLPMNPHTVGRRKPGSINPVISSVIVLVPPTTTVVISVAVTAPLLELVARIVVVLLEPFVADAGALTRTRNTTRAPGGNANDVVASTTVSPASSTPTMDCPPETGLSMNTCAVQPGARLLRKFAGNVIVSLQLPTFVNTCE